MRLWALIPWHVPLAAQVAKQVGLEAGKKSLQQRLTGARALRPQFALKWQRQGTWAGRPQHLPHREIVL